MRRAEVSRQAAHDSEPTIPSLRTKFMKRRNTTPRLVFLQKGWGSMKLTGRPKVSGQCSAVELEGLNQR